MDLNVAGDRCHLNRFGKPATASDSPPLLLIHGATNDRDAWQQVALGLAAAGCALLLPDLPGHGLCSGPAPRSIEALADWLPLLLDAAGIEEVVLVESPGPPVAAVCSSTCAAPAAVAALAGGVPD